MRPSRDTAPPRKDEAAARRTRPTPPVHEERGPLALVAVCAVALGVRLIVLFQLGDHPLLQPYGALDTAAYVELGRRVASGDLALGPGPYFLSPLYAYLLGAAFAVGGGSLWVPRLLQVLLGTAAVWLIGDAASRWFGSRAGVAAAALAALCGLFAFNEILLLQSSLDPFLAALVLWLAARALLDGGARWLLLAGAAGGLHALNRPNVLVFVPVLAIGTWVLARWTSRVHRLAPVLVLAGALAAVAPVTARNYVLSGELVLISTHGGLNLYIGNHENADGTYTHVPGVTPSIAGQARDVRVVAEGAAGRPLSDAAASRWFAARAREWIAANPGEAAALFARKLRYTVSATHVPLNFSYPYYRGDESSILPALFVGPWLLLPLGLAGAVLCFGRSALARAGDRRGALVAYVTWVAYIPACAVAIAVFFVADRYRLPLLVAACATGGALLVRLAEDARTSRRALLTAVGTLAAVTLLVHVPTGLDDGRADERTAMIEVLIAQGERERAEHLLAKAASSHPAPAELQYRVGRAWQRRGDAPAAIRAYESAVLVEPERPELHLALGGALLDAGRATEAVPHLQRAAAAGVRPDVAPWDLARALAASGRVADARDALRQLRPASDADARVHAAIGDFAARDIGDAGQAAEWYRRAAAAAPGDASVHERLGLALVLAGRTGEAIAALERASALDPRSATAHLNLAVAYAQAGRVADARARAQQALAIDPAYAKARGLLAQLR